jgi:hypothetical protein
MKLSKAMTHYMVDGGILFGFLGSMITGFVLWVVLPSGGYQGGRGVVDASRVFILGRESWQMMHNWLSLSMVAGVFLHLVLHWNWLICMTRKLWSDMSPPKPEMAVQTIECEI